MITANGSSDVSAARPTTSTARPNRPIATPASCWRVGCSPSTTREIPIEKITCTCTSSDASPAGIPRCSDRYSRENWPRLMNRPISRICRHGPGLGTKKIAGKTTTRKRAASSRNGGKPFSPSSITTKLAPQMIATSTALRLSLGLTP